MRDDDGDDDNDVRSCVLFSQVKAARSSAYRAMMSHGTGQFPLPILCSKHWKEGIFTSLSHFAFTFAH
jgi:hypothetical protein